MGKRRWISTRALTALSVTLVLLTVLVRIAWTQWPIGGGWSDPATHPALRVPVLPRAPLFWAASGEWTNPTDMAIYVYIPAGDFIMGSPDSAEAAGVGWLPPRFHRLEDEQPQHRLHLAGFWIMQTEVTNTQYGRCVDAGTCTAPHNDRWDQQAYADHPVADVDWQQATTYAQWVGGRLPTEAEWEKACRGQLGRIYPWGSTHPTADYANTGQNVGDTTPVGSYSPYGDSPYRVVDLAGNVSEWTSSLYQEYPYGSADGRDDSEAQGMRVLRGGAFHHGPYGLRCAYRFAFYPDPYLYLYTSNRSFGILGMRVVLSPGPGDPVLHLP